MRTADFILLLILWACFQFTPYRNSSTILFFSILAINTMNLIPMYIPRSLEGYRDGYIRPGHVISTFRYLLESAPYIMLRHMTTLIHGYAYLHTALAVEHRGRTYILNVSYSEDLDRSTNSYKNQIERVATIGNWRMFLEPLESFLEDESQASSYIRILDTGRHIIHDSRISDYLQLTEQKNVCHCAYLTAKYLEHLGISSNKSSLYDIIYYTPQYFGSTFSHQRDIQL